MKTTPQESLTASTTESKSKAAATSDQNASKKKDWWDKLDTLSKALAAIVMPIVLACIGYYVQKAITAQSTGKDYVTIALGILEQKDLPEALKKNQGLRKWAVGLLNSYSPVSLDDQTTHELIDGETKLPAVAAFEEIRKTQMPGPDRTAEEIAKADEILKWAEDAKDFDVDVGLNSNGEGMRLQTYVYIRVHPDFTKLERLVDSVLAIKDDNFDVYQGLRAIKEVIQTKGLASVDDQIVTKLRNFLPRLYNPSDLSRYNLLNKILGSSK